MNNDLRRQTYVNRPRMLLLKEWTGFICLVCLAANLYAWWPDEKLVRVLQVAHNTDAVLISDVSVSGNPLECGLYKKATQTPFPVNSPGYVQPFTPFQAPADWLSNMDISLVNRTSRNIAFGELSIFLLDTGDCSKAAPCTSVSIRFGNIPAAGLFNTLTKEPIPAEPARPALNWQGEQTLVIHVKDYLPQITQALSNTNMPVTSINKVSVARVLFYFDSGMRWEGGRFAIPDASHPGSFIDAPDSFFPGKRGHNFPPGYNHPEGNHQPGSIPRAGGPLELRRRLPEIAFPAFSNLATSDLL